MATNRKNEESQVCELCGRGGLELNKHHLIPRSKGGMLTVPICLTCHKQIHVLFDNAMLEQELGSIDALRTHPKMHAYLKWVAKRPGWFRVRRKRKVKE